MKIASSEISLTFNKNVYEKKNAPTTNNRHAVPLL